MSAQLSIDFSAARAAADRGMRHAIECAEYTDTDWPDAALAFLRRYATSHREFTVEQVTAAADLQGYGSPADGRAWGGIVRRAKNAGLIRCKGRTAPRWNGHGSPGQVWPSMVCGEWVG